MIVYKHTSPEGKVYVGCCRTDEENYLKRDRWQSKGQSYKNNKDFWNDIQKFGWDNFEHEIIEKNLAPNEVLNKEKEYIFKYQSNKPEYGYNKPSAGKAVYCYELNKIFYSITMAEEATGITAQCISYCCKGKTKTAGKMHWKFAEIEDLNRIGGYNNGNFPKPKDN